nr:truncated ORF1 [Porcine circovirus]
MPSKKNGRSGPLGYGMAGGVVYVGVIG